MILTLIRGKINKDYAYFKYLVNQKYSETKEYEFV